MSKTIQISRPHFCIAPAFWIRSIDQSALLKKELGCKTRSLKIFTCICGNLACMPLDSEPLDLVIYLLDVVCCPDVGQWHVLADI